MANVTDAVEYVLRQEDRRLSGVVTKDSGGRTRFGVAEKFHPELTSTGFYDTMPIAQALEIAVKIYNTDYAQACKITEINSQAVGNTLLSYAINSGTRTAIKMLQRTIGATEDGVMGPNTILGVNTVGETELMTAWKIRMDAFYEAVVEKHPENTEFLKGWLNRVEENTAQVANGDSV